MKKKIKSKLFSDKVCKLQKEIEKNIVDVMTQQGVKAISFIGNGNSSSFDVPKAYASVPNDNGDIIDSEIVLVIVEGKNILISTSEDINNTENAISTIEENGEVFSSWGWHNVTTTLEDNNDEPKIHLVEETYNPTDTWLSLAETIRCVLEDCMRGKKVAMGEKYKLQ